MLKSVGFIIDECLFLGVKVIFYVKKRKKTEKKLDVSGNWVIQPLLALLVNVPTTLLLKVFTRAGVSNPRAVKPVNRKVCGPLGTGTHSRR